MKKLLLLEIAVFYLAAIVALPLKGDDFWPGVGMITFALVGGYGVGFLAERLSKDTNEENIGYG